MEEIEKLLETWKSEKGSYIPNAPIYGMFIQELEDAINRQKVKNCHISDVGQSEQLKAEVFKLANKLAIAGEGDAAVAMHRIHNRL